MDSNHTDRESWWSRRASILYGGHRDNSEDSRYGALFPAENIIGRPC